MLPVSIVRAVFPCRAGPTQIVVFVAKTYSAPAFGRFDVDAHLRGRARGFNDGDVAFATTQTEEG